MGGQFEVEVRFWIDSPDEIFAVLPFTRDSLRDELRWRTVFHGSAFFHAGDLLRVSEVRTNGGTRRFLCWKDRDLGGFANIRMEIDEEITAGIVDSAILARLGGPPTADSAVTVASILTGLGHAPFMSFAGDDRRGYYAPLGLQLKIMHCPSLGKRLLLEIEKSAATIEEAYRVEAELRAFVEEYDLQARIIKEEPPTLLYAVMSGG